MKISVLTSTFPPYSGGMGNAAFHEAAALASLGHSVSVFTPAYSARSVHSSNAKRPQNCAFSVVRMPPLIQVGNGAVCDCSAALESDAVLLHYPFFGCAGRFRKRSSIARSTRLIVRYDMEVRGNGIKKLFFALHKRLVEPRILDSADRVIFSSFDYARHSCAARFLERHPGKCVEIPYGVDTSVFFRDPSVAKRENSVLFVGGFDRAHYFKGLTDLINAFALLAGDAPACTLTIVGNGERKSHYESLCNRLGISDKVSFLANCCDDELRRHYNAAAATVLPSIDKSESFGLVLLESMACGTPVVASDLPGVRTVVHDGVTGRLFHRTGNVTQDSAALADSIRFCLGPASLSLRENSHRAVAGNSKYDWRVIAAGIISGLFPA